MRKLLFSIPCLFAATFALNAAEIEDAPAKHHSHSHHHHHGNPESITTTFTLTPVGTTGFTLAVAPVAHDGLSIASDGTITLPNDNHWVINYSINFSTDATTRHAQFADIFDAIGAFQFSDSVNTNFIGSILNFDGTALIQTSTLNPITTTVLYDNTFADPLTTLVPLVGTVEIHRLDNARRNHCGL